MATLPPPVPPSPERLKAQEIAAAYNAELQRLRKEQNLPLGIFAGFIAAVVAAVGWAAVTIATMYQIGYLAIGVGFVVGLAVRTAGKGIDNHFGMVGGIMAAFGVLLGNCLVIVGFVAKNLEIGYGEAIRRVDPAGLMEALLETTGPIDFVFCGLALFAGYRYAFRRFEPQAG